MRLDQVALVIVVSLFAVFPFVGCANQNKTTPPPQAQVAPQAQAQTQVYARTEVITSSEEALKLLVDGNKRFVSAGVLPDNISTERKTQLSQQGQHPFAVIVSCSDSRVPPEIVFDQALGDIFVVRVAGNVVDKIEMGSIEYAVEHLNSPLVVVLGHEKCGAVKASVDQATDTENLDAIANKIKPAISTVKGQNPTGEIYEKVVDANVAEVVKTIKDNKIVAHLMETKKLRVVGAKYHLESGEVTYF